jgi:hypothetical protein
MINLLYKDIRIPLVKEMDFTKGSGKGSTIQYLTAWRLVGNSSVQSNEIWSCGEYSATDGKYHIVVLPLGKSPVDITLDEPLRKVNDVADTIEFANGVTTLSRNLAATKISDNSWKIAGAPPSTSRGFFADFSSKASGFVLLCAGYNTITDGNFYWARPDLSIGSSSSSPQRVYIKDLRYVTAEELVQGQGNNVILYELETPTTEVIQAPQIQEAESYSCVISQGAKAVEWSSFTPNPT